LTTPPEYQTAAWPARRPDRRGSDRRHAIEQML